MAGEGSKKVEVASAAMVRDLRREFEAFVKRFEKLLVNPSFLGNLKVAPSGSYILDVGPINDRLTALEQQVGGGAG